MRKQPESREARRTAARAVDHWLERMCEWSVAVSATQDKADDMLCAVIDSHLRAVDEIIRSENVDH